MIDVPWNRDLNYDLHWLRLVSGISIISFLWYGMAKKILLTSTHLFHLLASHHLEIPYLDLPGSD